VISRIATASSSSQRSFTNTHHHGERVCKTFTALPASVQSRSNLANHNSQCSWSIIIGLVVVLLACGAAWFFSPKGETQTYAPFLSRVPNGCPDSVRIEPELTICRIWRSSLILSFASCYIMWGMILLPLHSQNSSDSYSYHFSCTMASTHRTSTQRPQSRCDTRELRE
jgi:hypothetical protein